MHTKQLPLFEQGDDEITKFVPLHPAFNVDKTAKVFSGNDKSIHQLTNLATHSCSCVAGKPYDWHEKRQRWVPNQYCVHKLKVMSRIIDDAPASEQDAMIHAYAKALGTRYNIFEATSAFHKELRRGDVQAAIFWGSAYASERGVRGIVRYMLNILYEETRDHWLGKRLLKTYMQENITITEAHELIVLFCKSIKKWELPHRLEIFTAEMKGYDSLANDFTNAVAKGSNIIPEEHRGNLIKDIHKGVKIGDPALIQRGIKGLQKLAHKPTPSGLDALRQYIFHEVLQAFKLPPEALQIAKYIALRKQADLPIGYHELNALADCLLHDEPYEAGILPEITRKALVNSPKKPKLHLGRIVQVPIYAHDNHTWRGKSLMSRFSGELLPGAEQTHLDFRYCGAYYGVAWRYLAYNQHRSISVPFAEVKWPKSMHRTVMRLFY